MSTVNNKLLSDIRNMNQNDGMEAPVMDFENEIQHLAAKHREITLFVRTTVRSFAFLSVVLVAAVIFL